jgi:hypothetical protein
LKRNCIHKTVLLLVTVLVSAMALAQRPNVLQGITNRIGTLGNMSGGGTGDSLRSRAKEADSINIHFFYRDSSRAHDLDSSINDYTNWFPIPATHLYLGNTGSATKSYLFTPPLKAGWDAGFHAFDVYKWKMETVPFYNTTKPYTELDYALASKAEQIIEILHTQNLKPYWNASFHYRLVSAPGVFRNQKANHNNYLLTSWYQSPSKRYNNYFVLLSNKLQAEESGGLLNDNDYLNDPVYAADRYTIPSFIGGQPRYSNNFFNTTVYTGNRYNETNYMLRQQYDLGRKDSLVTDSTVIPLFYPRLRFEHTFNYGKYRYIFQDLTNSEKNNRPDSAYYSRYNIHISSAGDTSLVFRDQWKEINNDFSIYQFPDANNLQQFIKLGLEVQLLQGDVKNDRSLYNMVGHGEYRNRTRNQKWDIGAFGRVWLNGYNVGDYHAYVSLQRLINPNIGSLQLGFENVNRTPPFIYNTSSNFYLDDPKSFGKENTIHLFGSILQPKFRVRLSADYYLVSNYLYFTDYFRPQQEGTLFNVLRISASKTFNIGRRFKWYADVYVQQKTGTAQLNIPTVYTRHRFGYEGKLGFRHLNIAIGTEIRYNSPYKADNYSPVLGQFFFQDSVSIGNLPRIDGYLHFRIRSFRAFLRFENLNTASVQNGFGFTNNNMAAPGYPTPGLITRFGIFWAFVN